jgi:hypothetical protein
MHRLPVLLAVAGVAGVLTAPASARTEFSAQLTTAARNAPSGLNVHLRFLAPDGSDGKASPLRSAVIRGPRGLRFDTTALPRCDASDTELELLGADACPAESRLALGAFSAMTGFGPPVDPLGGDLHVFNGPEQIIEVITVPGTSASPAFDRLTIKGSTLTAHPPDAPGGPPDGKAAVRSIDYAFGPVGSFLTTPRRCRHGSWTITGTFGFADGTTDTVTSRSPCRGRAGSRARRPPTRRPTRAPGGTPARS